MSLMKARYLSAPRWKPKKARHETGRDCSRILPESALWPDGLEKRHNLLKYIAIKENILYCSSHCAPRWNPWCARNFLIQRIRVDFLFYTDFQGEARMRALVTGGAGFIGSYLIPELLRRGAEVVVFDLLTEPIALAPVKDKITYVRGDLSSANDLYRVMLGHAITDVFHLGSILAGPCDTDPIRGFRINFGSTQVLLDASLVAKVRRFLLVSSISVFGRGVPEPVRDDALKAPANIYGQTKLACELLLRWYADKHGLDTRALRFPWVYGPGRSTGITALYSSLLLDAVARGESVHVENPDERGDWLYVRDAVKALLCLYDAPSAPQRVYNIAGGVYSVREVMETAKKIRPAAKITLSEEGKILSPYPAVYDDTPARKELGWIPGYSMEDAVREHSAQVEARVKIQRH
jgi:UDP-glucose 4-epimerase